MAGFLPHKEEEEKVMRLYRRVNYCEFAHLQIRGEISAKTCGFAVIGPNEDLVDTDPRPPIGSVMFFKDSPPLCAWFGPYLLECEIPEDEIVWIGTGTYRGRDFLTGEKKATVLEELATMVLKRDWIVRILEEPSLEDLSLNDLRPEWLGIDGNGFLTCCDRFSSLDGDPHSECLEWAYRLLNR